MEPPGSLKLICTPAVVLRPIVTDELIQKLDGIPVVEPTGSLRLICTPAVVLRPIVTDELIQKLEGIFPDVPSRSMTHRDIDLWIGQQEVIRYLRKLRDEQQSDPLNLEEL